ncbi:unnamed protein product [Trichogramma brassicae]|uniref:Uncharacterized protein n=1 Tax=Trichogramma brassicae TaxID=86971 RepID=A0A6H5IB90_9HYME|nr:unnamed protein product [Trichogramma brassicae]
MKFVFFIRIYNEWLHKGYADRGDPELVFAAAARCGTSVDVASRSRVVYRFHISQLLLTQVPRQGRKKDAPSTGLFNCTVARRTVQAYTRCRGTRSFHPTLSDHSHSTPPYLTLLKIGRRRSLPQCVLILRAHTCAEYGDLLKNLLKLSFKVINEILFLVDSVLKLSEFLEHCTIDVWSFCCSLTETMLHRYPAATGTATATAPSVLYALLFTLSYTSTTTTVTALKAPNGHPLSYIHRCPVRFTYSLTSLTFPRAANMCCVYVCMRIPQSRAIFSSQRCPPYGHILYPSEQESARDTFGNHPLSIRDTRLKKYFFPARNLIVRAERDKKSYHRFKRFARATICYSDKTP